MKSGLPRLLAEFVTIVAGVLVALGVDSLVGRRNDRHAEELYLSRLASELRADSAVLVEGLQLAARGDSALVLLMRLRDSAVPPRDSLLLVDGLMRARVGGLPGALSQVTFDELRSTGAIRLIRDPAIRGHIAGHYARIARSRVMLDTEYTQYPLALSELLPAEAQQLWLDSQALSPAVVSMTVGQLKGAPDLDRHLRSKRGYLALQRLNLERAQASGDSLLRALEARR